VSQQLCNVDGSVSVDGMLTCGLPLFHSSLFPCSLVPHLEAHAASRAEASSAAIAANATAIGGATAAAPSAASSSAVISPSVIPPPRDLDPTLLAWKGMAVLPRLESANEMWVTRNEWDALGWKGVRDKA
jgi:actin-related protein